MKDVPLCHLSELEDPGSKGFEINRVDADALRFFVVRRDGAVFAYRNRCPHTGAPLEWQPDQFLDCEGGFIECAMHGALFDISDGRCLRGPCVGDQLEPLALSLSDDMIYLAAATRSAES